MTFIRMILLSLICCQLGASDWNYFSEGKTIVSFFDADNVIVNGSMARIWFEEIDGDAIVQKAKELQPEIVEAQSSKLAAGFIPYVYRLNASKNSKEVHDNNFIAGIILLEAIANHGNLPAQSKKLFEINMNTKIVRCLSWTNLGPDGQYHTTNDDSHFRYISPDSQYEVMLMLVNALYINHTIAR